MYSMITREQYENNIKFLEEEYEEKKAEICKKYKLKPEQYEFIAEIFRNEQFKNNIPNLARDGNEVEGDERVELL